MTLLHELVALLKRLQPHRWQWSAEDRDLIARAEAEIHARDNGGAVVVTGYSRSAPRTARPLDPLADCPICGRQTCLTQGRFRTHNYAPTGAERCAGSGKTPARAKMVAGRMR